jgi:hypothetical protein
MLEKSFLPSLYQGENVHQYRGEEGKEKQKNSQYVYHLIEYNNEL